MVFQVGPNAFNVLFQHIGALTPEALGLRDAQGNNTFDIVGRSGRAISQMIGFMDDVLHTVSAERAHLGASINRLNHITGQLDSTSLSHSEAYANVSNADFGLEMSRLIRRTLLGQAATSVFAQSGRLNYQALNRLLTPESPM